jgi:hypothetical protein
MEASYEGGPDILDITYDMRHRLFIDPRDKIFAIAGLVEDVVGGEDLRPDYSMTVEAAYEHLRRVIEF